MGSNLGNNYGKFYSFLSKPVLLDLNFIVDSTNGNGLGVRSVKGQGVSNVFMHTSATPGKGPNGYLNPNPASGLCLIELAYNYTRAYAGPLNIISPPTGSPLVIDATALTPGNAYVIVSPGHGAPGSETITTVADVSGSLASKYFNIFDSYGNNFLLWFQVSGVGSPPLEVAGSQVPVSITSGASAAAVATALTTVIENLPSGTIGVDSFTAVAASNVITVTSTANLPIAGVAMDGASPLATGFTFAIIYNGTNEQNWLSVGVPPGVVPAQGVSFIATASGDGGHSTGTVIAPGVSGILNQEIIGDPNQSIAPIPMGGSSNVGSWLLLQFLNDADALTAPANNTGISMTLYLEQAARVGGNQE
jgi:hypothetical protein